MKLLLVGYGKMGRLVEELAVARHHEIVGRIDAGDEAWAPADVAIDFSTADALAVNFPTYLERRLPVVIGTTGWYAHEASLRRVVEGAGTGVCCETAARQRSEAGNAGHLPIGRRTGCGALLECGAA